MAFLAVFDAAHPAAGRVRAARSHFTIAARVLIACGALVAIFAGMSVYADTANVAADSPLYPLKRLGESVQLAVAPAQDKAQLQATFAARRASELSDLEARKPNSVATIADLSEDLNADVTNSLAGAAAAHIGDGKLNQLCGNVFSAITNASAALHGQSAAHARELFRFEDSCGKAGNGAVDANTTTTVAMVATSTTLILPDFLEGSPLTATTTLPSSTRKEFHIRGGGVLNVIYGENGNNGSPATSSAKSLPQVRPQIFGHGI